MCVGIVFVCVFVGTVSVCIVSVKSVKSVLASHFYLGFVLCSLVLRSLPFSFL